MSEINGFADTVRNFLEVSQGDYYYDEYDSGLDHHDTDSISEIASHFWNEGHDNARKFYIKLEERNEVLEAQLQAEKEKVKKLIYSMKNNHAHHDDYSLNCGDEDCLGCVLEKEMEG